MKRLTSLSIAAIAALICVTAQAGTKQAAKLDDAIDVMRDFTSIPETAIPDNMLRDAYGVAVIPGAIKIGLGIGGNFGKGVLVVRQDDGSWSNPAFVRLSGGSIGWQIGAQSTDLILVFKDRRSVQGIFNDKLTIGAEASAAAGPVGRQTSASTDGQLKASIYSYSRNRGLFAGVSLNGAWFAMDRKANSQFYGSGLEPQQILSSTSLMAPQPAIDFVDTMTAAAPRIEMDRPIRRRSVASAPAKALAPVAQPDQAPTTYAIEPLPLHDLEMGGDETMF